MKVKIKSGFIVILFLLSLQVYPLMQGDVNGDNTISIIDALMTAQYYVTLDPPGFNPEAGDVDCSGVINIIDALIMAQYYVALINQFPCTPAPVGELVVSYLFDEPGGTLVKDSSGSHDATLVNGTTRVNGKSGSAVDLDGLDDHVILPEGVVSDLVDFTVATWVNLEKVAPWQRIFDFGSGTGHYMFLSPAGRRDTAMGLEFAISINGGNEEERIARGTDLESGSWQHVAVTLSGRVGILYLNGKEVGRNEFMNLCPGHLGNTTLNYIGRSQYADPYLDGLVDDFRIYSCSLTAAEIAELAETEPPEPPNTSLVTAAGELLISLNALELAAGTASQWPNRGSLGGSFLNEGTNPQVGVVNGVKCVNFNGGDRMLATFSAPAEITGRNGYTVEVWANNPSLQEEECLVQWAARGYILKAAQFNYGSSNNFGAVTHWDWPDMGWGSTPPSPGAWHHLVLTYTGGEAGVERIYSDGILKGEEQKRLELWPGGTVRLGNAENDKYFSGAIAALRIHSGVLNVQEIQANFQAGPASVLTAEPRSRMASVNPGAVGKIAFIKKNKAHEAAGFRGTNAIMISTYVPPYAAICVYDSGSPQSGYREIFTTTEGTIMDLHPSYDGTSLLFSYRTITSQPYHIWEIGVDGTGLRQLTTGSYHDVNPAYLPDGRIVFVSTRVEGYSLCQDFIASALHIMNSDGSNLQRINYSTICDTTPSVMEDGTILFSRWEYQDKSLFTPQKLWTLNGDGKRLQLFFGNTVISPNSFYGFKQIPGTKKVIGIGATHHFPPTGAVMVVDRSKGLESEYGVTNLTPEIPYPITTAKNFKDRNYMPGDRYYPWAYMDVWPIDENRILVSYGGPKEGTNPHYRLMVMNAEGDQRLLLDDKDYSLYCPVSLETRKKPEIYPFAVTPPAHRNYDSISMVPAEGDYGKYFVHDIYQGLLNYGVKRGDVKELRVIGVIPKKYNTEGPRYEDHYPAMSHGSYYPKYNYGTVPVNSDGMLYFNAPAGVELYFQALDASGKEIRRMGTITQITRGEVQGCIGCHEARYTAPANRRGAAALMKKGAVNITPPQWGAGPVDFVRQVQPVLDKSCISCHSGIRPVAGIDLSGDKNRFFNMAYTTLSSNPRNRRFVEYYWLNEAGSGNFPALKTGSMVSPLSRIIENNYPNHPAVNVDDMGRRIIYTWIDANIPYYGTWDITRPYSRGGRDTFLDETLKPRAWFSDFLRVADRIGLDTGFERTTGGLGIGVANAGYNRINLTHPEWSLILLDNLVQSAGGNAPENTGIFKSKNSDYNEMLSAIQRGSDELYLKPRMDMDGAVPVPQQRNFGRVF